MFGIATKHTVACGFYIKEGKNTKLMLQVLVVLVFGHRTVKPRRTEKIQVSMAEFNKFHAAGSGIVANFIFTRSRSKPAAYSLF